MSGRMSSRERMERMRAEADAAAREKAAARAEKAARPPAARRSSSKASEPPPGRIRIVWSVCDQSSREVKQFPYAQKQEADDEAARQTAATGRSHFVMKLEVPFG